MKAILRRLVPFSGSLIKRNKFNCSNLHFVAAVNPVNCQLKCGMSENLSFSTQTSPNENSGETFEFKAETQKLLHIMAHSLYTDKEVFIRELISNASDALEKRRLLLLQSTAVSEETSFEPELQIKITPDSASKTLTFEDTGIGMSRDELINYIGSIASSSSAEFLKTIGDAGIKNENYDVVGQFGVGFYSTFVVSKYVEIYTASVKDAQGSRAWHWKSDGTGTFTINEYEAAVPGTKIICHLRDDCVEYCNPSFVEKCIKNFSSFMRYPLYLIIDSNEKLINEQEPIWTKSNPSEDEKKTFYKNFYKSSYDEPLYTLMYQTDAPLSIKSIFYFPQDPPSRIFQTKNEVDVALHSRRVIVKKSADGIIPKWLSFVKGVIDCDDIPLNISRENMQDSRLMEKLSETIVRRILKFLVDQSKNDEITYLKFYNNASYFLKEGLLEDIHGKKLFQQFLIELLRFETSKYEGELITLDKYIESISASQKYIYYFCASSRETALLSPYMESFLRNGVNVILLYEEIDEFVAMNLQSYKDKKLISIDALGDDTEHDILTAGETDGQNSESLKLDSTEQENIEQYIKATLGSKVNKVKCSDRLFDSPAVVTGFLSFTLRKMMKATVRGNSEQTGIASIPVTFEINPKHEIIRALLTKKDDNPNVAKLIVEQLFDNACVAAGILDDPRTMLQRLNQILSFVATPNDSKNFTAQKESESSE